MSNSSVCLVILYCSLIVLSFNPMQGYVLLIFERKEGGERERYISVRWKHRSVASCMCPDFGAHLQPERAPRSGTEATVFWCTGQHSNPPSHPARATTLPFVTIGGTCSAHHFSKKWKVSFSRRHVEQGAHEQGFIYQKKSSLLHLVEPRLHSSTPPLPATCLKGDRSWSPPF